MFAGQRVVAKIRPRNSKQTTNSLAEVFLWYMSNADTVLSWCALRKRSVESANFWNGKIFGYPRGEALITVDTARQTASKSALFNYLLWSVMVDRQDTGNFHGERAAMDVVIHAQLPRDGREPRRQNQDCLVRGVRHFAKSTWGNGNGTCPLQEGRDDSIVEIRVDEVSPFALMEFLKGPGGVASNST